MKWRPQGRSDIARFECPFCRQSALIEIDGLKVGFAGCAHLEVRIAEVEVEFNAVDSPRCAQHRARSPKPQALGEDSE